LSGGTYVFDQNVQTACISDALQGVTHSLQLLWRHARQLRIFRIRDEAIQLVTLSLLALFGDLRLVLFLANLDDVLHHIELQLQDFILLRGLHEADCALGLDLLMDYQRKVFIQYFGVSEALKHLTLTGAEKREGLGDDFGL